MQYYFGFPLELKNSDWWLSDFFVTQCFHPHLKLFGGRLVGIKMFSLGFQKKVFFANVFGSG